MSLIAIITARGGSKRIPRKNIKNFMGKPMLAYAIEAALKSKIFDEIMVSTDDREIAEISIKYGAKVPFLRSERTSNDYATTVDVLTEVITEYKKLGKTFDEICCVYPCVPFLTGDILKAAYLKFSAKDADSLIPVVKYSFPIQRALIQDSDGYIKYREPEYSKTRSQDLTETYHDVGMFYFAKTKKILEKQNLFCKKSVFYEMQESQIQDIDNESDWKMAEIKYKMQNCAESSK